MRFKEKSARAGFLQCSEAPGKGSRSTLWEALGESPPTLHSSTSAFQTSHISIWSEGETQISDIITRSVLHPDRRYCPKHPAEPAFTWQQATGSRHGERWRLTAEFHLCLANAAAPGLLAALAGAFRRWKYKSLKKIMEKIDPASLSTWEFSWGCRKNIIKPHNITGLGSAEKPNIHVQTGVLEALTWSRRASVWACTLQVKPIPLSNPTMQLEIWRHSCATKELIGNSVLFSTRMHLIYLKHQKIFKFGHYWHWLLLLLLSSPPHCSNRHWCPSWVNIYEKVNRTSNRTGRSKRFLPSCLKIVVLSALTLH